MPVGSLIARNETNTPDPGTSPAKSGVYRADGAGQQASKGCLLSAGSSTRGWRRVRHLLLGHGGYGTLWSVPTQLASPVARCGGSFGYLLFPRCWNALCGDSSTSGVASGIDLPDLSHVH